MAKKKEKYIKAPIKKVKVEVVKETRRVALRNVEKMKALGWEECKTQPQVGDKVEGVKVHASDMVLMEK